MYNYLDFEKPVQDLELKILELKKLAENGEAVDVADEISRLLVEQVTGQVRWRETVEWFAANDVTTLYEIGSGKVLTGLARRIDKTVTGIAVNSPADIDAALQTLLG